ncbi:MAG: TIM barrel protein [Pirellulaceae bacterium]
MHRQPEQLDRRGFLAGSAAVAMAATCPLYADEKPAADELALQVGITTSSLSPHVAARPAPGKITLLELPRMLRDELDMRVIDLNTSTLASSEPKYLDRVREAADKAGSMLTNLKMNQRNLDMNSTDDEVRRHALKQYKHSIDTASRLGCRWARPLPQQPKPDMRIHVDSYRELAEYAAERDVQMLVENYGWMSDDPESVPRLIEAIDRNVAASPDTGNWTTDEIRYAGLAKAFPLAVTCDFKARQLGPEGQHPLYDLRRCFDVGWKAGFRGPWCLEHANPDRKMLFRELGLLRDKLREWMSSPA